MAITPNSQAPLQPLPISNQAVKLPFEPVSTSPESLLTESLAPQVTTPIIEQFNDSAAFQTPSTPLPATLPTKPELIASVEVFQNPVKSPSGFSPIRKLSSVPLSKAIIEGLKDGAIGGTIVAPILMWWGRGEAFKQPILILGLPLWGALVGGTYRAFQHIKANYQKT